MFKFIREVLDFFMGNKKKSSNIYIRTNKMDSVEKSEHSLEDNVKKVNSYRNTKQIKFTNTHDLYIKYKGENNYKYVDTYRNNKKFKDKDIFKYNNKYFEVTGYDKNVLFLYEVVNKDLISDIKNKGIVANKNECGSYLYIENEEFDNYDELGKYRDIEYLYSKGIKDGIVEFHTSKLPLEYEEWWELNHEYMHDKL